MRTITAKVPTKLKKKPISSTALLPSEMIEVPVGKSYGAESINPDVDGHSKVTLSAGSGTFFIFNQHWDGLSTEIVSRVTAEYIFDKQISNELLSDLNACCDLFKINTPPRLRHFLSQIAHESGGLQWLQELASGDDYEWRDDLGNNKPGDGRRYKGGGAIQLTGRANYQAFADFMSDPKVMDGSSYVAQKFPFSSAGFWWTNNDMNTLCDRGATVEKVTRRVNGGINGLDDRIYYYNRCCDVI
mgnify:CR=1 FL=1